MARPAVAQGGPLAREVIDVRRFRTDRMNVPVPQGVGILFIQGR